MNHNRFYNAGLRTLVAGAILLALALYALNLWLGNLNQDEGWYLYAALEQAAGRLPYRDFFFSQGPFMPRFYGLLAPLWSSLGIAGGRALTAPLGLTGAGLAAWLATRLMPPRRRLVTGVTVFLLTAGNVYHSYFTTIPKTYALASLLLLAGLLALRRNHEPGAIIRASLAGFLMALAACTRLSLGIALPVTGLYLLWYARRWKGVWLGFGIGGIFGLMLLLAPVLTRSHDQFIFANFFHATRGTEGLVFALGSVSRLLRNYLPLAALALTALALAVCHTKKPPDSTRQPLMTLLPLVFAAIFAVHLLSPFPYDDYQVPIMPLLAIVVAVGFWRALPVATSETAESRRQLVVLATILIWSALCAGSSSLNEDWMIVGKDRLWIIKKEKPDLVVLRETARRIAAQVPADEPLLTQDVYLAVEAKRRVPTGFEMGPFCYFPQLTDEEALHYHVLNEQLMKKALSAKKAP